MFFCIVKLSFSQSNYHEINSYDLFYSEPFIELSNIGDPLLLLIPKVKQNISISHFSKNIRLIDYFDGLSTYATDSIYSAIIYQTNKKNGGTIKSLLSRPLSNFHDLYFSLTNVSSEGFYQNQSNKYNNMYLYVNYLDLNNPYSYYLYMLSNNGIYDQNGGLVNYSNDVTSDLLTTYLENANTSIKKRFIHYNHRFKFKDNLAFAHSFKYSLYERFFLDTGSDAYHYDFFINNSDYYQSFTSLKSYFNDLYIETDYINLGFSHYLYNTSILNRNFFSDFILSAKSIIKLNNLNDFIYKIEYCPVGYNSHDYNIKLNINNHYGQILNKLELIFSLNKPDLYNNYIDNNIFVPWSDLFSTQMFHLSLLSNFLKNNFISQIEFKRYNNFLYFDSNLNPTQISNSINYLNLTFNKLWNFGKIKFKSFFSFQSSNSDIMLFPTLYVYNKFIYTNTLSDFASVNASITNRLFTRYNQPSFSPILDIFYNSTNSSNFLPFLSADIYFSMDKFSIGLIFDNIHALFLDDNYTINHYYQSEPFIRFSLMWEFNN